MIAAPATPGPVPYRVQLFAALNMSREAFAAACMQDDAERELKFLRPLSCDEDRQDFESQLAVWHEARKDMAKVPTRLAGTLHGGGR